MIDVEQLSALAGAHLWQSLLLAGVLAIALIKVRQLSGSARYHLAGFAMAATIILPFAALIPGTGLTNKVLTTLNAPVQVTRVHSGVRPAETNQFREATTEAPVDGRLDKPTAPMTLTASVDSNFALSADLADVATIASGESLDEPVFARQDNLLTRVASSLPDLSLFFLSAWIIGALVLMVKTARDLVGSCQMVSRSRIIKLPGALERRFSGVTIAVSDAAQGPMAAGVFRARILLPESFEARLQEPGIAALLEHERAHVERRDMLVGLIQRIVTALLWWSPAIHWLSRRMDEEREIACDEAAVERTGDARAFALTLTTQAETQLWSKAPQLAVGAIGTRTQFGRRISRLVEQARNTDAQRGSGRAAFAGLAIVAIAAACLTPSIQAEDRMKDPLLVDGFLDEDALAVPIPVTVPPEPVHVDVHSAVLPEPPEAPEAPELSNWSLLGLTATELGLTASDAALNEVLAMLPEVIDQALAAGLEGAFDDEAVHAELQAAREEIRTELGENLFEEIRDALEEARAEIESIREERADLAEDEARAARESARHELEWVRSSEFRQDLEAQIEQAMADTNKYRSPEFRAKIEADIRAAHSDLAKAHEQIRKAAKDGHLKLSVNGQRVQVTEQLLEQIQEKIGKALAEEGLNGKFNLDVQFDDNRWRYRYDRDRANDDLDGGVRGPNPGPDPRPEPQPWRERDSQHDLMEKIRQNDRSGVIRLIDDGADINFVEPGEGTALILAIRGGHKGIVRVLLDKGADPNLASAGDGSALIEAARIGDKGLVHMLLESGADPNLGQSRDGNPLIVAAQGCHQDIAQILLEAGADVNGHVQYDETPLIKAAESGCMGLVRSLVDRGADVNLAFDVKTLRKGREIVERRSPLWAAQEFGNEGVADYLRSKGAILRPAPHKG